MSQENLELLQRFYAAFERRDLDAAFGARRSRRLLSSAGY
jgi:hypothetical protein